MKDTVYLLNKMASECQIFHGSLDNLETTVELAEYLSIAKITYRIFVDGTINKESDIYSNSLCKELGNHYDFSIFAPNKEYSIVIRIYRNRYAEELSEDSRNVLDAFASILVSSITVYTLYLSRRRMKNHDDMGLTNKSYYLDVIERIILQNRQSEYYYGHLNIKNCNKLNSIFGSSVVNDIIENYGKILLNICNEDNFENVSRLGGDSFAFVIHENSLKRFVETLKDLPIRIDSDGDTIECIVNCRAGIVKGSNDYTEPHEFLSRAALTYRMTRNPDAKNIIISNDFIISDNQATDPLANELLNDLKEGKLLVYYQPIFKNDEDNTIVAAEALVRWRRSGELIRPASFIPTAEKFHFITDLDKYVLNKSCETLEKWISEGKEVVPITFNFSHHNFANSNISDEIIEIVDSHNIDHSLIIIELKEAAYLEEYESILFATKKLQKSGIRVTIDSFGKGYSSLSLLKDMEFDYLKLSSSFINDDNEKTHIIVESIISMASKLKIDVICQGIKDKETEDDFSSKGVKYFQSDYLEKALSERFFQNRLSNKNQ